MNQLKQTKINRLLQNWPKGTVCTSHWLSQQGIRFDLLDRYRKSNWVKSIGHGAVIRYGDKIEWAGGLYALQHQLGKELHPGAKTALQLAGYAHFLPLGENQIIQLFSIRGELLPKWFINYNWGSVLEIIRRNIFKVDKDFGKSDLKIDDFSIKISAPERAILEMIYLLPERASFNEIKLIMENLATLRPGVLQKLLEHCSSIKVKRIFMALADDFQYDWLGKIDVSKISFGQGKRSLFKGGYFHPKYQITLPENTLKKHDS